MSVLGVVLAVSTAVAEFCGLTQPHELDATAVAAGPPPDRPLGVGVDVNRGSGPFYYGCGQYKTTDCDALGSVDVVVDLPEGAVGFAVRVASGAVPEELELPQGALRGDAVTLTWPDGAVDEQEPVSFLIDVVAVDASGQASEPVRVEVSDPGRDVGPAQEPVIGCTHVEPALPLGLAVLLLRRRRR